MNLIEKAMEHRPAKRKGRPPSTPDEMIDLSVAWAEGRLTLGQCIYATRLGDTSVYARLACSLRAAVQQGKLVKPSDVRGWK